MDAAGALAAERETNWRGGYLTHFRRLVEAGLPSGAAARTIAETVADGAGEGDGEPSRTTVCTVIGFPHGTTSTAAKVAEAKAGEGLDAATGEYVDMVAAGIIDPVKVTRSALRNAASIAGLVLTTDTLVVDKPAEEDDEDGHGHGHSH